MRHTMNTVTKFFSSIETYFFGLLGMLGSFLIPIVPFLALCGLLILADTITGIRAAIKRGEKPNSRKASRVIDKTLVYGFSILACHGVEVVMKLPDSVTYFAVGAIAFTELMSVLENTRVVSGVPIAAVIGGLFSKFQQPQPKEEPEPEQAEPGTEEQ